jgi:hypothetical protein
MNDSFIEQLKGQIAYYQSMLEPLESGKLRIGDSRDGQSWTDRTKEQIADIKRIIAMLQSIVERG